MRSSLQSAKATAESPVHDCKAKTGNAAAISIVKHKAFAVYIHDKRIADHFRIPPGLRLRNPGPMVQPLPMNSICGFRVADRIEFAERPDGVPHFIDVLLVNNRWPTHRVFVI